MASATWEAVLISGPRRGQIISISPPDSMEAAPTPQELELFAQLATRFASATEVLDRRLESFERKLKSVSEAP